MLSARNKHSVNVGRSPGLQNDLRKDSALDQLGKHNENTYSKSVSTDSSGISTNSSKMMISPLLMKGFFNRQSDTTSPSRCSSRSASVSPSREVSTASQSSSESESPIRVTPDTNFNKLQHDMVPLKGSNFRIDALLSAKTERNKQCCKLFQGNNGSCSIKRTTASPDAVEGGTKVSIAQVIRRNENVKVKTEGDDRETDSVQSRTSCSSEENGRHISPIQKDNSVTDSPLNSRDNAADHLPRRKESCDQKCELNGGNESVSLPTDLYNDKLRQNINYLSCGPYQMNPLAFVAMMTMGRETQNKIPNNYERMSSSSVDTRDCIQPTHPGQYPFNPFTCGPTGMFPRQHVAAHHHHNQPFVPIQAVNAFATNPRFFDGLTTHHPAIDFIRGGSFLQGYGEYAGNSYLSSNHFLKQCSPTGALCEPWKIT